MADPLRALAIGSIPVCLGGLLILGDYSGASKFATRYWSTRVAHWIFAITKLVVLATAACLHLSLLFHAHLALFATATPPTHAQRVEAVMYACVLTGALLLLDATLGAVEWCDRTKAVLDCCFESEATQKQRAIEREAGRVIEAAETADTYADLPSAWVALIAIHLAYVVLVPLFGRFAPDIAGDTLNATLLVMAVCVAFLVPVTVAVYMFQRTVRTWLHNKDVAPEVSPAARAAIMCPGLGVKTAPSIYTSSIVRVFVLIDTLTTAIVVLLYFDTRSAADAENWRLIGVGMAPGFGGSLFFTYGLNLIARSRMCAS